MQQYIGISFDDKSNKYLAFEKLQQFQGSMKQYIDAGIVISHKNLDELILNTVEKYVISFKEKLQLIRDALHGLRYLHESGRSMHGNLKPSNILINFVNPEEEYNALKIDEKTRLKSSIGNFIAGRSVAKLTDYGFLHFCKDVALSQYDTMFRSPEILDETTTDKKCDDKGDIYSMSLIIYSLLFQELPYTDFDIEQVISGRLRPRFPFEESDDDDIWNWFNNNYANDEYIMAISYNAIDHYDTARPIIVKNIKTIVLVLETMWSPQVAIRPTAKYALDLLADIVI